jgi:hypothetical protein
VVVSPGAPAKAWSWTEAVTRISDGRLRGVISNFARGARPRDARPDGRGHGSVLRRSRPLTLSCAALALVLLLGVAPAVEAKRKLIAARQFQIPQNIPGPQPPTGSATIVGQLGIRGCFTSVSSNGRKVKCPGAVLRACTEGRRVEVQSQSYPPQLVTTGARGSIAATVPYPGGYWEVSISVPTERRRAKGLKISCFGSEEIVAIDDGSR